MWYCLMLTGSRFTLNYMFDHFTQDRDAAFDFIKLSLENAFGRFLQILLSAGATSQKICNPVVMSSARLYRAVMSLS